jgi:hypothetical protein
MAWGDAAELFSPAQESSICRRPVLSVQDCGQDAEKIEIPLALARSDLGMVILEEAPDLAERYQIIDLQVREIPEHDAGAGVELPVLLEFGVLCLRNQSQNTDEGKQKTSHP